MCEAITERSVVGELRLRCQALENRQEKENEKFNKLKKQVSCVLSELLHFTLHFNY